MVIAMHVEQMNAVERLSQDSRYPDQDLNRITPNMNKGLVLTHDPEKHTHI
jgi:hypothetical protein